MVQQILLLGLYIIIAVCFLEVRCQGTPVLTIAESPITVGDGDQYAELKCQIAKSSDYITRLHRLQRKQADSSYTTIATVSFQRQSDTIVNDAVLGTRSNAVWHDPSTTKFLTGSLQIHDVISTDAGMYRCETQVLNTNMGRHSFHYSTDVELVTIKPPPTESPIELPTEPPTPETRAPTTQLPGTTEAASSVNVGAVAAGVSVPLLVIIVVLIAIICFYRRRQKSLSDRLIERLVAVGNGKAISCVATPAIQVSYVTLSRTVNEESDRNGCYDEIKDTDNLGTYADYGALAAVNAIRPNNLPDPILHIGSPYERRSKHHVNDADEYEMASAEAGSVPYDNIERGPSVRCYEKLTRAVPIITHTPPENSYGNHMVEDHGNHPTYENMP